MNNKDFKWTEKRFGLTFANILKKLGGLSKNDTDGSLEYKDEQGNVSKLVTDSTFSSLLAKNGLIEVTWQELKDKRDNGQLIPGSLYRIIDYNCTTTQENTQSAGHQFDIVLLALSENKLAEEGWAMVNESNIYNVTFANGAVKKCYIFRTNGDNGNLVDCETLLGAEEIDFSGEVVIDEQSKTATTAIYNVVDLSISDLQYNYFQNSNLSAWKVWYSLDNDKSRFAWALEGGEFEGITIINNDDSLFLKRSAQYDRTYQNEQYYAWNNEDVGFTLWTKSATPNTGDTLYIATISIPSRMEEYDLASLTSYGTVQIADGHGVIYRLIDEFGNDLPWDFKNILRIPSEGENYYYTVNTNSFDPVDATMDGTCTNVKVVTEKTLYINDEDLFIIYSISKYLLSQCVLYINKYYYQEDWLIGTNKSNFIYGLEIYDPNA